MQRNRVGKPRGDIYTGREAFGVYEQENVISKNTAYLPLRRDVILIKSNLRTDMASVDARAAIG